MSGFYNHDGGYIDNLALGEDDVNRSDIYGGRLDLLLTPTERFSARLTAHAQDISRDGEGTADFDVPGGPVGDEHLTQSRPVDEPFEQKFRLYSATLDYDFGWANLTSISGYQEVTTDTIIDFSDFASAYGPFSGIGNRSLTDTSKFTQEVRLTSAAGGTFEWVLGGFYTDEETESFGTYVLRDLAGQPTPNTLLSGGAQIAFEETAVFGTLTWHLTDKFDVSGGVRYSENEQAYSTTSGGSWAGPPQPLTNSSGDATTYLANARYRFDDQSMVYVRYATGYRPGGPNLQYFDLGTSMLTTLPPFESDSMRSYEAGFRSETADRRFAVDLAAYYIDWENIIIRIYDPATGANGYDNAAGMRVRGAELALTARPVENLVFVGAIAYTDAYMVEDNAQLGAVAGERMPTVPRFTVNLMGDYTFSGAPGEPTIGATIRYVDDRTASFDASTSFPQYYLPEYTSVDLRTGWDFDAYEVQIYARNVFDERGQTSAYTWQGRSRVGLTQPRTIGVTVTTHF
jgi:outer membrane receptor protein involved in Fe transport